MKTFVSAEEFQDRIPTRVMAQAKAMLLRMLMGPRAEQDIVIVDGWTLEPHELEYRIPEGGAGDIMNRIVQRAAYDELVEKLEDLSYDEEHPPGEIFQLGNVETDGAIVLIRTPQQWWTVSSLEALSQEGLLEDYTYGNDSCPSLGKELMDGQVVQVYVGHMHPDHYTRQDGCDPRFAIYVFNPDDGPGEPAWTGESEVQVAKEARRLIEEHGGPRRQLRSV